VKGGDVINQLRSWVRLADSRNVGVNYENLMFDLMLWNKYADDIRVKWARAFWQSGEASVETANVTTT
jgi:CRISPR type I-E-associated protein CasB/Cse2